MKKSSKKKKPDGKIIRKMRAIGLPPGTLVEYQPVGERPVEVGEGTEEDGQYGQYGPEAEPVTKTYFEFDEQSYQEENLEPGDIPDTLETEGTVSWLDVTGLHNKEILEALGKNLSIHPLVLEDIQNTDHRPKIDDYERYLLIIFKMLQWDEKEQQITTEQVALLLGKEYVVTFQERAGDVFEPIRERIRSGKGRVRKSGADYLAYALIDTAIDHYYLLIESLEDRVEEIEDAVNDNAKVLDSSEIHRLRKQIIMLRKSVWPLREMLFACLREDFSLISENTKLFLKDVYDHVIQVADSIELLRELLFNLTDLYNTNISNSTNAVMKVLTIIATIFIPLTFVAGIYGMNFDYMPELQLRWGYFVTLGVMAGVAVTMLIFFKRKKWL